VSKEYFEIYSSDEGGAYSLINEMASVFEINVDSLHLYSIYNFNDTVFFPVSWREKEKLSNLEFQSISKFGYYLFITIESRGYPVTIIKATAYLFSNNGLIYLGVIRKIHTKTPSESKARSFFGDDDDKWRCYFNTLQCTKSVSDGSCE
jgi:hypothetical protein